MLMLSHKDVSCPAFRRIADQNPQMLVARSNEAAVYMECGRSQEAMRTVLEEPPAALPS